MGIPVLIQLILGVPEQVILAKTMLDPGPRILDKKDISSAASSIQYPVSDWHTA
jgi:hypothetical protein